MQMKIPKGETVVVEDLIATSMEYKLISNLIVVTSSADYNPGGSGLGVFGGNGGGGFNFGGGGAGLINDNVTIPL